MAATIRHVTCCISFKSTALSKFFVTKKYSSMAALRIRPGPKIPQERLDLAVDYGVRVGAHLAGETPHSITKPKFGLKNRVWGVVCRDHTFTVYHAWREAQSQKSVGSVLAGFPSLTECEMWGETALTVLSILM